MANNVRVLLQADVDNLGTGGEVVKVRAGYARNFLLPRGLALPATAGNLARVEELKKHAAVRAAEEQVKAEGLKKQLEAVTVKGSVFSTDESVSDNDLSRFGRHVPIDHGVGFADGEAHINGIEGFWSVAKRLHRLCHGVDREHFPVYLSEYEIRHNHRDDHLVTILFDRLYRPQIEKGRLP